MKKRFNHHKLARRWRRKARRLRTQEKLDRQATSLRNPRGGRNPFRVRHCEGGSIKKKIEIAVLCILLIMVAGVFIYHPFFHIRNIKIAGLQRIAEDDFRQTIVGAIQYRKFGFLPAQSYPLVSPEDIRAILMEKYPINALSVKKEFPGILRLAVEEKITTLIFDDGKTYSYRNLQGEQVEVLRAVGDDEWYEEVEIATTTLADGTVRTERKILKREHRLPLDLIRREMGEYPVVYQPNVSNDAAMLDSRVAENSVEWFVRLQRMSDIPFGYIELSDVERHALIHTREGWGIRINIHNDPADQFDKLMNVLSKVNRQTLQYIDVRFLDRVYWQ